MKRKMISPDVVAEIERLLAEHVSPSNIAGRLEISSYVVEVVALDDGSRDHPARPPRSKAKFIESQEPIEYATIRIIERLLSVGVLSYPEIAREVGISKNTICDVAMGRRTADMLTRPRLNAGEKFLPRPERCGTCGARVAVVPCRACRARKNLVIVCKHQCDAPKCTSNLPPLNAANQHRKPHY